MRENRVGAPMKEIPFWTVACRPAIAGDILSVLANLGPTWHAYYDLYYIYIMRRYVKILIPIALMETEDWTVVCLLCLIFEPEIITGKTW